MLITENQLDEWVRGNDRDAQGVIVELVYRLVAASSPRPRERRFPLGDSIGQHGPDGILEVDLPFGSFIPEGRSFWQIGTGHKVGDKATSDYNNLVKMIPASVRSESTFIFVTPRSGRREWGYTWKKNSQSKWLEDHRKKNEWKNVQVIDATKLVDWLHQFPPVELWLAKRLFSLPALQVETPEHHWSLIRTIGEPPPLTPHAFLANRDDASAKLKELFAGTVVQLKLETHFPDQVVDFVSACIADLDIEKRTDVVGRCLIISGVNEWQALTSQKEKLILIANFTLDLSGAVGTKLIQIARRAGHAIIFGGPPGGIPDPTCVPLPAPRVHHLQDALEKAGYSEERARIIAQKSNGNLGSLLRCLQNLSILPEWAESSAASDLAIAVLLGSWTEKSGADRTVVEAVSGKLWGEWIGKMREVALCPGTPLNQLDGKWKFITRYEGWYSLGLRLFDEHLDRLHTAAISVLKEKDPKFDLPSEERFTAQIYGKNFAHSSLLRSGLAESLAFLGSHPKALKSCTIGKAEVTAVLTVRAILADADWQRWASLNDLLPMLAEAAPEEFLSAVEKTINTAPCPFDEIFAQEGDGFMGSNFMSGVLWALETLAWDENCLSRVLMCLGELAARDPGGRWANRPAESLTTILLPWLPQTCASIAKRGAAVTTLINELPDIGWKLVISLLPQSKSTSTGTRKPAWREIIPDGWSKNITQAEYWEQIEIYSQLAIATAKNNREKVSNLISHLEHLPPKAREQLLLFLGSDSVMTMPEADRLDLWVELVDLVIKHKKYPEAGWRISSEEVEEISALADRLAPTSPFYRHQRLFSERDLDLYEEIGNYEKQSTKLEAIRRRAVEEVAASGGPRAVIAFAACVESPWRVGVSFGIVAEDDVEEMILPNLLDSAQKPIVQFAGGYVWGKFRSLGWNWVDHIDTLDWAPEQIGQFLSLLPFTLDTWERSRRLLGGDESAYWNKTSANPYNTETNLEPAIDQLIQYGRPYAAIRCLHKMLYDKKPIDNSRAVRALIAAINSPESVQSIDAYDIVEIIKALQNDPCTNHDDLFRVEWAYLSLLDEQRKASPKLLWRRLANDPRFFCELIRLVFRPKKADRRAEEPSEQMKNMAHNAYRLLGKLIRLVFRPKKTDRRAEEPSEQMKNMAHNAYRLLGKWRIPPGLREDGMYDGDVLIAWLKAVKKDCSETGHLEIAMSMVGHVLTHVPPDLSGLWINCIAARVLNAKDAGGIRAGFRDELYNLRGVHWVDPTGNLERELALKYRSQADAVEVAGFHRLAATIRELAKSYEREAERIISRELPDD